VEESGEDGNVLAPRTSSDGNHVTCWIVLHHRAPGHLHGAFPILQ
jgi:hypothetical protein